MQCARCSNKARTAKQNEEPPGWIVIKGQRADTALCLVCTTLAATDVCFGAGHDEVQEYGAPALCVQCRVCGKRRRLRMC